MGYIADVRFTSVSDMVDAVNEMVERNLREMTTEVEAKQLGLDPRAGYRLMVTEEYIVVYASNRGVLDYYGGFEYVDSNSVSQLGDYVFYSAEDDRVADCLEQYFQTEDDEDDPGDVHFGEEERWDDGRFETCNYCDN